MVTTATPTRFKFLKTPSVRVVGKSRCIGLWFTSEETGPVGKEEEG